MTTAGTAVHPSPWSSREFRGLIAAQVASEAGDQIARVALALLVLDETGSALGAAVTLAILYIPVVFGAALLGSVADRLPRRTLMLVSDFGRAVIVLVLALLAVPGTPVTLVFCLLLLAEFLTPLFDTARAATVPAVLPDPTTATRGFGVSRTLSLANQVLGLLLGGAIIALFDSRTALFVDAASFFVSFAILALTLTPREAANAEGSTTLAQLFRDSITAAREMWTDESRRVLVLLAWCLIPTIVVPETLGLPYARSVGAQDYWGAVLMASVVCGMTVGAYLVTRLPLPRQVRWLLPLTVLSGILLLPTGIEPPLPVVTALWFAAGVLQGYLITINAVATLLTPDAQRGRFTGLAASGLALFALLGMLLSGVLADRTTPAFTVTLAACAGFVVTGIFVLVWPRARLTRDVAALASR